MSTFTARENVECGLVRQYLLPLSGQEIGGFKVPNARGEGLCDVSATLRLRRSRPEGQSRRMAPVGRIAAENSEAAYICI